MKLDTAQLTNLVLFALKENRVDYPQGKALMDGLTTLKTLTDDTAFMEKFSKEAGGRGKGGRKPKEPNT